MDLEAGFGRLLAVLADGRPRGVKELIEATGLSSRSIWNDLTRCWEKGLILRCDGSLKERERVFRGRAGSTNNLRNYYLYVLWPRGANSIQIEGRCSFHSMWSIWISVDLVRGRLSWLRGSCVRTESSFVCHGGGLKP